MMHDKVLVLHGLVAANCNLFLSNHYTRKIDQIWYSFPSIYQHLVLVSDITTRMTSLQISRRVELANFLNLPLSPIPVCLDF